MRVSIFSMLVLSGAIACDGGPEPPREPRAPQVAEAPQAPAASAARCADYDAKKRAYFGDLHIHTSYSLDSFSFANRNDPLTAYRFARGQTSVPAAQAQSDGVTIPALPRPLHFAAVTDHSEFLSLMGLCDFGTAQSPAACAALADQGSARQTLLTVQALARLTAPSPNPLEACQNDPAGCAAGVRSAWQRLRDAAALANDPCRFTSLVGYEWTATTGGSNLHRNVIFSGDVVPEVPIDYFTAQTPLALWRALDASCRADAGCKALTIPHNSNASDGKMWDTTDTAEERAFMMRYQRLVEIYQHKGASECLPGDANGDPECSFELLSPDADARGFVRAALAKGLGLWGTTGSNPLALGIIASTDTHNGTAGDVRENLWRGHTARTDDTPAERLGAPTFGPGGIAAVWAEENTRAAIFAALERRETYATSGPRLEVRTYALSGVSDAQAQAFCADPSFPAQLLAAGAKPMGAELRTQTAPTIFVWAKADQTPLASFDIVRMRELRTSVHTVQLTGSATTTFCRAWRDPTFLPGRPAAYYVRVLEQPTPRWSSYDCQVAPGEDACQTAPAQIRERAWTSPMFVLP
jgi:hypothetical protein